MNLPKFSIITPTYNVENRITETILSVEKQTYSNYEIIIMDAKSTDNTIHILREFKKKDSKIKVVSAHDKGIYDAMNKGVMVAQGEYCIFLGAGDTLYNETVLAEIAGKIDESNPDIIYGYVMAIEDEKIFDMKRKIDYWYTLEFIPVCHQAIVAKRELLLKYPFDVKYKIAADQEWLMHMMKEKKKFMYVDVPISYYPRDGVSSSAEGGKQSVYEQELIHKKYYPIRRILKIIYKWLKKWIKKIIRR